MSVRGELAGTLPVVESDSLVRAAALLHERNAIDAELAELIDVYVRGSGVRILNRPGVLP